MLIRAYSVYDNKALVYHQPFFAATDGAALRSFQELANDVNTTVGRHPGDYSIWWVGTWSDEKGFFEPMVPVAHVADANSLVKVQPEFRKPVNGSGDAQASRDLTEGL